MIVVIGGGPAGLSAALAAANSGSHVLLIDSSTTLGGQFWRHSSEKELGGRGKRFIREVLGHPHIELLLDTSVWRAENENDETTLHLLVGGEARIIKTKTLILATGAYDRSLPFPGWDLPGVVSAGAAQALLKSSGVIVGKRIVVAGTGPFLLPVAWGLSEAGAEVVGLFEANRLRKWFLHPFVALTHPSKIKQARFFSPV